MNGVRSLSNIESKCFHAVSFKSLPSDGSLEQKSDQDEQQSDFLDSLQILSISVQQKIDVISKYFPDVRIANFDDYREDYKEYDLILNTNHQQDITWDPVKLTGKCLHGYPKRVRSRSLFLSLSICL